MQPRDQIIFPHIPKTAGTSFTKGLVAPNVPPGQIRSGNARRFLKEGRKAAFFHGHTPHGLARFSTRRSVYVTFLRDPIDRAVSWYYFIKGVKRLDLYRRHPLRNYADSVSIGEFYENPKFANMQTRFIAGIMAHKLYPYARFRAFDRYVLRSARRHLSGYACFGLRERFDESIALMQQTFGWENTRTVAPQKKTKERPSVGDLMDRDPRIVDELRQYHKLDLESYAYASDLFDRRVRRMDETAKEKRMNNAR